MGLPQGQQFYPKNEKFFSSDTYIENLFSPQRIETRLFYFKELTLPTVLNQTYQNFEWILFISNLLPIKYKDYVKSISDKMFVIEVNNNTISNSELIELHSPKEHHYISSRLDEDDGLCIDYFELCLNKYQTNNLLIGSKNHLIVSYNQNHLLYSKRNRGFLVSSGFSCKDRHVYGIGSHSRAIKEFSHDIVSKQYPSIQSAGDHTITGRNHLSDKTEPFTIQDYMNNNYE